MHLHPVEMYHDFRRFYNVSADKIGTSELSWEEAYHLILALAEHGDSLVIKALSKMDKAMSLEAQVLVGVQNTIVHLLSMQADKKNRPAIMKLMIDGPKQVQEKKPKRRISKQEAETRMKIFTEANKKEE